MTPNIDSRPTPLPETGRHYQIPVLRSFNPREVGGPLPLADGTLDINSYVIGRSGITSFFFGVKSNEFLEDGILAGDKVLVDTAATPGQGDLIIASKGSAYQMMRLYDPAKVNVWGVVTGVVRKLRTSRA
ncbi:hypothetical protein [Undibacterium sp.]|jgi:DNA polymerase V|uniref:LexA family protein n=1 Tax=Undibacterium sp. TaxID=1914977 RepID=UPI002C5B0BE4|nr:hypothetical protein [Undibacterium sp.]HTD02725.1 hypothetical protein [Undibacterium sp.]